jgi:Cys-rich four helix bundle protein (predicted Tat secretion target)
VLGLICKLPSGKTSQAAKIAGGTMNRRELLGAAVGSASIAIAANTALAEERMEHMDHMDHAAHAHLPNAKLSEAARSCVSAGDLCISHCLVLFTMGDTTVAGCAKSAYQMTAVSAALARLASANSVHLPELAKVAHAACLDCEKECRKHEKEHAICKACADACAAAAEECKKVMA